MKLNKSESSCGFAGSRSLWHDIFGLYRKDRMILARPKVIMRSLLNF